MHVLTDDQLADLHRAAVLLDLVELADTELQRSVLLQMVRELIAELLSDCINGLCNI